MRPMFIRNLLLRQYSNSASRNALSNPHSHGTGVSGVLDGSCSEVERAVENFHSQSRATNFRDAVKKTRQEALEKKESSHSRG